MLRTLSLTALLLAVAFAGCIGGNAADSASGTFVLAVVDDAETDATFTFEGVWGANNDTGAFARFVDANTTWGVDGGGDIVIANGSAPVGAYAGLRVAFSAIAEDGEAVHMATNGFDLPLDFAIEEGAETRIELAFSWPDTLFDAEQGRAFTPALAGLTVTEAGETTVELGSKEIQIGDTKPPVARMRIFDATGLQVFESDFVAESPVNPLVANAGNITFAGSASEAIEAGTEIESYEWFFDDGTVLEGITVEHPFPVTGGNHTVRLAVEDSAGGTDTQTVTLAVKPGRVALTEIFTGEATGVLGEGVGGSHNHTVDNGTTPGGLPAYLTLLDVQLEAAAGAHPGHDLMLEVLDGEGNEIGSQDGAGSSERVRREYSFDDHAPPSGDWIINVDGFSGAAVPYEVTMTLEWQVLAEDPAFAAWVDRYDDGHNHEH